MTRPSSYSEGADASLWVLEAKEQARAFYEHRGWRHDGGRNHSAYPPYPPVLRYVLELGGAEDPIPSPTHPGMWFDASAPTVTGLSRNSAESVRPIDEAPRSSARPAPCRGALHPKPPPTHGEFEATAPRATSLRRFRAECVTSYGPPRKMRSIGDSPSDSSPRGSLSASASRGFSM
jgi:hypothetical protein